MRFGCVRAQHPSRPRAIHARKWIQELTAEQIWGSANAHKNVCTECNGYRQLPSGPQKIFVPPGQDDGFLYNRSVFDCLSDPSNWLSEPANVAAVRRETLRRVAPRKPRAHEALFGARELVLPEATLRNREWPVWAHNSLSGHTTPRKSVQLREHEFLGALADEFGKHWMHEHTIHAGRSILIRRSLSCGPPQAAG